MGSDCIAHQLSPSSQPTGLVFGDAALRQARIFPRQTEPAVSVPTRRPIRCLTPPGTQPISRIWCITSSKRWLRPARTTWCSPCREPSLQNSSECCSVSAQEAGLTVSGFVDSAVAAVSTCPAPDPVRYLDLHLQHINVTELTVSAEVRRTRAFEVRECGLSNLLDSWVNLIADRFVRETRFDPLVTADTEQQLYNQVYDWISGAPQHGHYG